MPILMALVGYQKTILVHDRLSPQARPAAAKIVENLGRHDHKVSYQHQGTTYHCLTENQIHYIAITDPETPARTAYGFLEDMKTKFKSTFAGSSANYPKGAELNPTACAKFSPQIAASIRMFNENPDSDKIGKVKAQIEGVRQVMLQNIDDILERGEKIDNLVCATDELQQTANTFEDRSRTLKREMIIRNLKILAAIIIALLILSLIISWIACGIDYKKCKSDDPPPPPPAPPATPTPATPTPPTPTPSV
jgi:vesicle-associated membrane protein 7